MDSERTSCSASDGEIYKFLVSSPELFSTPSFTNITRRSKRTSQIFGRGRSPRIKSQKSKPARTSDDSPSKGQKSTPHEK